MPLGGDAATLGRRLGVASSAFGIAKQPTAHEQTQSGEKAEGQDGETRLQHSFGLRRNSMHAHRLA
jgi:hypothetical protein